MPFVFYFLMMLCTFFMGSAMANTNQTVFGYIEKVTLVDNDLTLSAKLDTGAKSASLNASHIKEITKHGKSYLSFIVPSKQGDKHFECEYIGKVNIKNRAEERRALKLLRISVKRPVVLMAVRLGNQTKTIRVNLTNRKHFIYPMLLGREAILAFNGVINPSKRYIHPAP
jgi:hypothetical protein